MGVSHHSFGIYTYVELGYRIDLFISVPLMSKAFRNWKVMYDYKNPHWFQRIF